MSKRVECGDGRVIVFEYPSEFSGAIEKYSPSLVLLSSDDEYEELENIVSSAVRYGCQSFACVGPKSENLHDAVDDVLISKEIEEGVTTTWHAEESIDDVSYYFVNIAGRLKKGKIALLVLVSDGPYLNEQLKEGIIKEVLGN